MIAYLEGNITYKTPTHIYVDVGGLAYELQISLNTYAAVENLSKSKLFTHLIVRDDAHTLFGFSSEDEKEIFRLLISVSGVGPNTARVILSYMTPEQTKSAISTENVGAFKQVKGVGPKTAQRIILDLKDKMKKSLIENGEFPQLNDNSIREEAISALLALGFQRNQISKSLNKVLSQDPSIDQVEVLIKAILRQLS